MSRYVASMQDAVTNTPVTAAQVLGSATKRVFVYDFMLGTSGTPDDQAIQWFVERCTTAGTGTGVSESPLDSADGTASATAFENFTAEPTAGSLLIKLGVNQRATYRWVAAPRSELVVPATASNGIVWSPQNATYTGNAEVVAFWSE